MNSSVPVADTQVGPIAGPLLIGHLFNWGLFGTLTVQTYIYYMAFPRDPVFSKAFVHSIYLIEFIQTILATHDAWDAFGGGWGAPNALNDPHWLWFSVPVLSGIISCSVQLFLGYRIFKFSNNMYLAIAIAIIALVQGSAAIASGAQVFMLDDLMKLQTSALPAATVWLAGSAICDIFITSCMFVLLSRGKSGFKSSEALITRLIRVAVETGLLTATFAVIDLILFLSLRHRDYHIVPALTLSKLYSNSLLALLNSRASIINGRDYGHEVNWQLWQDEKSISLDAVRGPRSLDIRFASHGATHATTDPLSSFGGINVEVRRDVIHDDFPMTRMTNKHSSYNDFNDKDPFETKREFEASS